MFDFNPRIKMRRELVYVYILQQYRRSNILSNDNIRYGFTNLIKIHPSYLDRNIDLITAAEYGHTSLVKLFVRWGVNPHFDEDLALVSACWNGYVDTVIYLLDLQSDIHCNDDEPIRIASLRDHFQLAQKLFERGSTPINGGFIWACCHGNLKIVRLYLSYPININQGLEEARKYHRESIVRALIKLTQLEIEPC